MKEYTTTYQWRTQTNLPPPNGTWGANNSTWSTATQVLYLDNLNQLGNDFSPIIKQMRAKDRIKMVEQNNLSNWILWELDIEPIDYTEYFTFPGKFLEINGTPTANAIYDTTLYMEVSPERTIAYLAAAAAIEGGAPWFSVYAVCNDQTLWTMAQDLVWRQLPSIPQPPPTPSA